MPEGGREALPPRARRRPGVSLRDVLTTAAIGVVILGLVVAFNWRKDTGETTRVVPYVGGIPSGPAPRIGEVPQDFAIPLLGGGAFRLSEQRGKRVWINFWASWCPPCRAEMPDIQRVWQEVKDQGVVLIAIDFAEPVQQAADYVRRNGFTFPIGIDPGSQVATEYRLAGLPTHFFIDQNGVLREIRIGLISLEGMRQRLEKLERY